MKGYKVITYAPEKALQAILQGLASLGYGKIGNYDSWSVVTPVRENFRPLNESQPTLGKANQLQEVPSFKIELQCKADELDHLIEKIKELHPYESPAIEALELAYPSFK